MNILIMNGGPAVSSLDGRLHDLKTLLEKEGHTPHELVLRDMKYSPCRGCFSCWVKNPGTCIFKDDGDVLCREVINSDLVILASPLIMGYPSALIKNALDRIIPLIHPYLEGVDGEAHHMKRYDSYPALGLLLEKEEDTDDEDMKIVEEIFRRASINLRSSMKFFTTTETPVEEVIHAINRA
jgi:multimeric flavodoxin WrbA